LRFSRINVQELNVSKFLRVKFSRFQGYNIAKLLGFQVSRFIFLRSFAIKVLGFRRFKVQSNGISGFQDCKVPKFSSFKVPVKILEIYRKKCHRV
jgi:hypothetical protein